ncbi:protein indeterminate-domain 16-like [Malania oleifera]|uniref:protein indeterminate-domain 16-like n=1 Tax=Malania oleifera TaxID=397392 RepID=UPI0025AE28C8|nr:protein indeterminate-domain 16-like [Malania oleifera]
MLGNNTSSAVLPPSEPFACLESGNNSKRKRRPAGTPDPDAEVVSLSPKTLLESDRYVCEICNQGFQRDQNLQMHRRRHKVPWKLLKRETAVVKKRVFVCPEPTCLHHHPSHALGDLVGIKKHFRRKHSNHKQWVCHKCSKAYAVQSDYKAHLKTCGTRGHSCDCGRVFSRVESFIEHQDACNMGRLRPESETLSRTASSPSPSSDTNLMPWPPAAALLIMPKPTQFADKNSTKNTNNSTHHYHNLELQLLTSSTATTASINATTTPSLVPKEVDDNGSTQLQLSIGLRDKNKKDSDTNSRSIANEREVLGGGAAATAASRLIKEQTREELEVAMAEKAYAEEARQAARRQIQMAEQEFNNAKRIRQQAQAELDKAKALKEHAARQINSAILHITCHACKHHFHAAAAAAAAAAQPDENSLVLSYNNVSSAITDGEVENDNATDRDHAKTSTNQYTS